MRRESKNIKKKPHHIIFQLIADDMFFHEIIIIIVEKLNIAKNYLNSIEYVCMYIHFTRLLHKKDLIKNIFSALIYIIV